jgi:hypothetical protein
MPLAPAHLLERDVQGIEALLATERLQAARGDVKVFGEPCLRVDWPAARNGPHEELRLEKRKRASQGLFFLLGRGADARYVLLPRRVTRGTFSIVDDCAWRRVCLFDHW